jgi:hypothetical protein
MVFANDFKRRNHIPRRMQFTSPAGCELHPPVVNYIRSESYKERQDGTASAQRWRSSAPGIDFIQEAYRGRRCLWNKVWGVVALSRMIAGRDDARQRAWASLSERSRRAVLLRQGCAYLSRGDAVLYLAGSNTNPPSSYLNPPGSYLSQGRLSFESASHERALKETRHILSKLFGL